MILEYVMIADIKYKTVNLKIYSSIWKNQGHIEIEILEVWSSRQDLWPP